MGEVVTLTIENKTGQCYLARPAGGAGSGVLLVHAWWGLNAFFMQLADRLSDAGFVALAPDLYSGRVARTVLEAEQLRAEGPQLPVRKQLVAAKALLQEMTGANYPAMGVAGFSMGGHWALWLAAEEPENIAAAVVFYGTRGGDYSGSNAEFLLHFAEKDPYVSAGARAKLVSSLRAAGRPLEAYTYPGTGHWFFEADRPDAYDPQAAYLAWQTTVRFLRRSLISTGPPRGTDE